MRFVVLHHTGWAGRPDHYDLLLQVEAGGSDDDRVLKAFASTTDEFPLAARSAGAGAQARGLRREAARLRLLPDHRRAYLSFEGPVAGGRGQVRRVDEGELDLLRPLALPLPPPARGGGTLPAELHVRLAGRRLNGFYILKRLEAGLYSFARSGP